LVVTDLDMPGPSGLELIQTLSVTHPEVATVMVTGKGDRSLGQQVLEAGAYGYLAKPFDPDAVLIGVFNALRRRKLEIEGRDHKKKLEEIVRTRTSELWDTNVQLQLALDGIRSTQDETIKTLARAAEFRDDDSGRHNERMSRYCALIAERVGESPEGIEMIRHATMMHDIGKIAVPDRILLKPGPLTPEEREVMQRHAQDGFEILDGSSSEVLQLAATVALTHHEHWDGGGYPRGLAGADIPFEGRIAAIADVFDAITSDRVYRKAYPLTEAVEILRAQRGRQFDPNLLDIFMLHLHEVLLIKQESYDSPVFV
jgi:putative two-component system response regulator